VGVVEDDYRRGISSSVYIEVEKDVSLCIMTTFPLAGHIEHYFNKDI
jgi:hypothetical protein